MAMRPGILKVWLRDIAILGEIPQLVPKCWFHLELVRLLANHVQKWHAKNMVIQRISTVNVLMIHASRSACCPEQLSMPVPCQGGRGHPQPPGTFFFIIGFFHTLRYDFQSLHHCIFSRPGNRGLRILYNSCSCSSSLCKVVNPSSTYENKHFLIRKFMVPGENGT